MSYFNAKMHQIWSRPRAEGAHSAPLDPLAGFKGPTSKGREGEGGQGSGGEGRVFSLYLSIRGFRLCPGKFLMAHFGKS